MPDRITHPERIVFPGRGVTKGDVAAYYDAVADRIAPHLADRPLSLLRAPEGLDGETFFQRHPLKGMTRGVRTFDVEGKTYFALAGAEGLRAAAQFGAIELHGWTSRRDALDKPDRLIFDLDPDAAQGFDAVKAAARLIAERLAALNLKSWPLLTGGKGVHVVVPLDRSRGYAEITPFARGFARALAREAPDRFVASMSKAARQGRIFIDWLRNAPGASAILPWSLRARSGASVAVPVGWDTLDGVATADAIDIFAAAGEPDDWAGFFETRQTIPRERLASVIRGDDRTEGNP